MSKTAIITLGGVDYEIDRLPIGVLRELDAVHTDSPLDTLSKKEKEIFFFDQCITIIHKALETKDPTISVEKIKKIQSDMSEIFDARLIVLKHAGLVVETKAKVGEESPVAS